MNTLSHAHRMSVHRAHGQHAAEINENSIQSQAEVINMLQGVGHNSLDCQDSLLMTDQKMAANNRGNSQTQVSYYYPLRGQSSIVPQMGSHPTDASHVQLDEDFINNERLASELARKSQMNFKNAMKIQNHHLNHMISYLKSGPLQKHSAVDQDQRRPSLKNMTLSMARKSLTRKSAGSRNSNNQKSPLSCSKKSELINKRLLNASQVSRDKIETPQQYKLALQARKASRQIIEQQRRAAEREAMRMSGTRFASSYPNSVTVCSSKPRARSSSNFHSNDRGSFHSGSRRVSSHHAQSDQKQIRRRLPAYRLNHQKHLPKPKQPKQMQAPHHQYRTQQVYQYPPNHLNLADYQQMTEPPERLELQLKNVNHYSSSGLVDKSRNEFKQQNQDYGNGHVQMASAEFAMSSNNPHNFSNDLKPLNTYHDFSGYVDTTPNESSVQDPNSSILQFANLRQPPLPNYLSYGQPRVNHVQNNTFGQEDVQCLADTYNFELMHNNQNIFDHRQKLSGVTSDCLISNVNKDSSIQNMSNANQTRELTEKGIEGELSSMLSNQITSRTNQRSKKSHSRVRTKSSISSKKDVVSNRRVRDSKPRSNDSNSVSRSIRSFIGLKNKTGSGQHSVKNSNQFKFPQITRNKGHQSVDFQINSQSQASLATAKTLDSKFKSMRKSDKQHREAQVKELKKLLMMKQVAKADRYYFDSTVRKYFCIWIEKFIEAIKSKNMMISNIDESIQQSLNPKPFNQMAASQKSKSREQNSAAKKLVSKQKQSHTTLSKSELEDDSSKLYDQNFNNNSKSLNSHMLLNQLSSPGQQIRSDTVKGVKTGDLEWFSPDSRMLRDPNHTLSHNRINDKSLRSKQTYPEEPVLTQHSLQESILNIDSKNNNALENFFAPQNAFKTSKVTRNVSTMASIENQNNEFRQTAQLGQRMQTSGEKKLQMLLNDKQFKRRLNRGLKIISKYNARKLELEELDQRPIKNSHKRSQTGSNKKRTLKHDKSSKSLTSHVRTSSALSKKSGASRRSGLSRSKSGASRSVSQKSHSRCPSRISNPSKVGVSNRTITTSNRNRNHIFSSLDNQRTLKGENFSQSNIRQARFLEKPNKLLHSQRPVAMGIRESKSSSPVRQSFKTTSFEDETSRSRYRAKLSERQLGILRIFFVKWLKTSMVHSSRPSRRVEINPRKVHRFNMKLRIFRALKKHMIKAQALREAASFVYESQIQRKISRSFIAWIQAFNENRVTRKNTYIASCHWIQNKQQAVFRGWRRVVIKRRMFRSCIRQVVPATCLLLLLRFSPSMPREMNLSKFVGQELFECTKYIKMSSVDQRTIVRAFAAYQRNYKKAIFDSLRKNYLRVCSFKANVAMKITKACIFCWRSFARSRRLQKQKLQHFIYKQMVKTVSQIVHFWKFYSKQRANIKQRFNLFRNHFELKLKRQLLNELSRYSACRVFKNHLNMRAADFINRKLKSNLLVNLISYNNYRQQKKMKAAAARLRWAAKMKVKLFHALKSTLVLFKTLERNSQIIQEKHLHHLKSQALSEWILNSKIMRAARYHHRFRQKINWFQKLKEAVLMSQIRASQKQRATEFLRLTRKSKLVNFLRDFKFEQDAKRLRRVHLLKQAAVAKKRLLFLLLARAIQSKVKNARLKLTLTENYKIQLKTKIMQRLARNVVIHSEQRQFEQFQTLRFKAEMFDCLRFAVVKQKLLRQALITTIEKRNRRRAELFLEGWRRAAVFKFQQKQGLYERQKFFMARRAINKFQRVQLFNTFKVEIQANSEILDTIYTKRKFFTAMKQFSKSRYVQAQRLARFYRRKQLIAPAFVGLKKRMCLKHIQNKLQTLSHKNTVRLLFSSWIQLGLTRKLEKRAVAFLFHQLKRKSFHILVSHLHSTQSARLQSIQIERFISTRLAKTALNSFKIYPRVKNERQSRKEQTNQKLSLIYLSQRLKRWKEVAEKRARVKRIAKVVMERQRMRVERNCWRKAWEVYKQTKKDRIATCFSSKAYLLKVFNHLKAEAIRTKRIEALGAKFNRRTRLMKAIFQKVLENRNKRIEARNMKKWGTKDPNLSLTLVSNGSLFKNRTVKDEEAMVFKGRQLKGLCFDALRRNAHLKLRLKHCFNTVAKKANKNMKRRFMREICDSIIIQPKLDAVADLYRLQTSFKSFIKKVRYIRDRQNGLNMHEFEIRAYNALGKNLMRKCFCAFKMVLHTRRLKEMESKVVFDYQIRKWFSKWRHNYIVRAQASYMLPPIDQQNFRERHGSRSKSKSRERLLRSSKQKQTPPFAQVRRADPVAKSMNVSVEKSKDNMPSDLDQSIPYNSVPISNGKKQTKPTLGFSLPSSEANLKPILVVANEYGDQPYSRLKEKQLKAFEPETALPSNHEEINESLMDVTMQLNDTVANLKPQRHSPGKQPKQSPQKFIYQIDQSDERLYNLAKTMNDGLKNFMVINENESDFASQQSKVPPLHNLAHRLQKSPMNTGQNSFKAFLSKKAIDTLESHQENVKEASGKKSNMLSNQSLDDDEPDQLPTALYQ